MRIEPSPLVDRLIVPLLVRLITQHGPRHLLVLLFDVLLGEGQQFRRIVAFEGYTLAIQLADLTGSLESHENDHVFAGGVMCLRR